MDLTGARRPRWRYLLLDSADQPIGNLDGVSGGTCEVAATTRLGGTASVTIDERGQGIDWMAHRMQIIYDPGIRGVDAWPIATMLFTSPKTMHGEDRVTHSVDLLPKVAVIDEDSVSKRYSLPAGAPIIATVVGLIRSTGESRIAVTESAATLRSAMTWDAAESKLTIINDLLSAAGYWALWCDGSGQFRVEPYVLPQDRPVAYGFQSGEFSIHKPDWGREQDLSNVPNRFVVVGEGTDKVPALSAVATNEDPESPFSYQARGRWISRSEIGAEGSQAVLNALAKRRLSDAMSPVAKLDVTHAIVPLDPGQVIDFQSSTHSAQATIQRMTYRLEYDGQCDAEWREI